MLENEIKKSPNVQLKIDKKKQDRQYQHAALCISAVSASKVMSDATSRPGRRVVGNCVPAEDEF